MSRDRFPRSPRSHDLPHHVRQLQSAGEALLFSGSDDSPGDTPGESFFPVLTNDAGELRDARGVYEVFGGTLRVRVHSHVEGPVVSEAEPSLGVVEVEGRNPEIREYDIEGLSRQALAQMGKIPEVCLYELNPSTVEPFRGDLQDLRILIQPDQLTFGT